MFDFLKKKAQIEFYLDQNEISLGGKLKGKVVIKTNSNFTSKSLNISLSWTERGIFYNEKPFIRNIQGETQYFSSDVKEILFDIDFVNIQELELWYDKYARGSVSDEEANHKAFLDEIKEPWVIKVDFDIPGIKPSIKKEINII
ncbi:MAG: hypothetical protein PHN31_01160 [Candidatus Gracilibacteria bacterium]|nr:hypothetical protein [Candidatus Gracilibacteria bacterium]